MRGFAQQPALKRMCPSFDPDRCIRSRCPSTRPTPSPPPALNPLWGSASIIQCACVGNTGLRSKRPLAAIQELMRRRWDLFSGGAFPDGQGRSEWKGGVGGGRVRCAPSPCLGVMPRGRRSSNLGYIFNDSVHDRKKKDKKRNWAKKCWWWPVFC